MAFKLAELFVEITGRDGPFRRTLALTKGVLMGMGGVADKALGGIGRAAAAAGGKLNRALGVGALAAGAGIAVGMYKAIQGASDLNETLSKVGEVFGGSASEVTAAADQMAKAFGIPKREFLDAASQFGLIAQGMGMSKDKAAGFSTEMAKLAADASSFYNIPVDQALEKIRAGLTGESEPLKALGVIMTEESVKAQALAMGFRAVGGELSNEAKLAARTLIIQRGLAAAHGDLERTSSGAANQSRKFWGTLENLGDTVGTKLLPVFGQFLNLANQMLGDLSAAVERSDGRFGAFVANLSDGLETAGVLYRNFGDVVGLVKVNFEEAHIHMGQRVNYLADVVSSFLDWFGNQWLNVISDALEASSRLFFGWFDDLRAVGQAAVDFMRSGFQKPFEVKFQPLLGDFKPLTTAPKLPEQQPLLSLEEQRRKLQDAIAEREAKRLEDQGKAKAGAAVAKQDYGQTPQGKQQKVEHSDLAGFAKKLQEGALSKGLQKAAESTAKNTEKALTELEKIAAAAAVGAAKGANPGFAV